MPSPLLLLRLSLMLKLTMATEDTVVMEAMVDTALAAMVGTDTERGPLMPMPTTAMVDTDTVMVVMALATAVDTAMARGPLMLMPMPTTAMVDTDMAMAVTARGPLMLMPMAAMVDTDMAMARGPLTPRLT